MRNRLVEVALEVAVGLGAADWRRVAGVLQILLLFLDQGPVVGLLAERRGRTRLVRDMALDVGIFCYGIPIYAALRLLRSCLWRTLASLDLCIARSLI